MSTNIPSLFIAFTSYKYTEILNNHSRSIKVLKQAGVGYSVQYLRIHNLSYIPIVLKIPYHKGNAQ